MNNVDRSCEWLQTNRFGSFAMGSVDRVPRRKYHSLLCLREPGRGEALNAILDVGEYIETNGKLFMLHAFDFGDRVEPKGFTHLKEFSFRPSPRWEYEVDGLQVTRALKMDHDRDQVRLYYSFRSVKKPIRIQLTPFVLCRPFHHLTQENPFLNGGATTEGDSSVFHFYDGLPPIHMRVTGATGRFVSQGRWVQKLQYAIERERGYPFTEDTYIPGYFEIQLDRDTDLIFEIGAGGLGAAQPAAVATSGAETRYSVAGKLEWAGEQYLLTTKKGFHSIIAGYPWFGHWGRDTFISMAGLCLESGEFAEAERILESYGDKLVEGLTSHGIVCAFPDSGLIMTGIDTPLLFIRAVQQLRDRSRTGQFSKLMPTVCKILNALRHGADKRVHVSVDGGLFVQPGPWAVTWMDVMLDGQPVTPRAGFAVDINALFHNAVCFAMDWAKAHDPAFVKEWTDVHQKTGESFLRRFWSDKYGYLADSHDGTHADFSLRPNQLWALALPFSPVTREQGARVLDAVKKDLVTPVGLRTLSPRDPKYIGKYRGDQRQRDLSYHQGAVWPWLIGIYADALMVIHGAGTMKKEMGPILERLAVHMEKEGCLGHVSEIFDGDAPHDFGGTPAQAWSIAELIRVNERMHL